MEKTVQFKKEIPFESNIINSISLEKEVTKKENNIIEGYFILEGEKETDKFEYKLPFKINVDQKYNITNSNLEITNFTYNLEADNLLINIEVTISNIEETEDKRENDNKKNNIAEETLVDELNDNSIFSELKENEYQAYKVHVLKKNETLETILEKYEITKEAIEEYNDLNHLKIGDKIIVPSNK